MLVCVREVRKLRESQARKRVELKAVRTEVWIIITISSSSSIERWKCTF